VKIGIKGKRQWGGKLSKVIVFWGKINERGDQITGNRGGTRKLQLREKRIERPSECEKRKGGGGEGPQGEEALKEKWGGGWLGWGDTRAQGSFHPGRTGRITGGEGGKEAGKKGLHKGRHRKIVFQERKILRTEKRGEKGG